MTGITTFLNDFLKLLNSTWSDAHQRILGWLDWAPKIANDLDDRRYTRDLGVFVLDEAKFQKNFKGNYVYLGAFCFSFISLPDFRLMGTIDLQQGNFLRVKARPQENRSTGHEVSRVG
jgi:hypothetical protein